MKSNKIKTSNKTPQYYPQYSSTVFAINLCTYLDDPIPENHAGIRWFPQQCSGTTCKGKRCRHKVKVEVAYDSAETDPPKVYCSKHTRRDPDRRDFNLVIQEVGVVGDPTPKHQCVWVGTGMPQLDDADTMAYQVLTYVGDDPKPRPRLMEGDQVHGFDCDKELWVEPNTYVRIYYVREAGRIHRTHVSAQSQLDTKLQAYKTVVETMEEAGTGECVVCLETKPLRNLGCSHNFCQDCIARFSCKKAACPMCRAEIQCLTEMANTQGELDRLQIESPDYEVRKFELHADCVYTYAYKIQINKASFQYPDLHFSPQQEMEYRVFALLLEKKLVFVNSSYDDTVYVRDRLFGNTLMDRIGCHDADLVKDLVEYALECGLESVGVMLGMCG